VAQDLRVAAHNWMRRRLSAQLPTPVVDVGAPAPELSQLSRRRHAAGIAAWRRPNARRA
jgi:hypothetical protein